MTPTFYLSIAPSKSIAAYLTALHFLLILSLFYLPLSAGLVSLLVAVIVMHCGYCLWRYCYSGHRSWIDGLEYSQQTWLLHRGQEIERVILKSATVWRWMVVLNFRSKSWHGCSLLLLPDNTHRQQLRRLRVMLKHRPVYGADNIIL